MHILFYVAIKLCRRKVEKKLGKNLLKYGVNFPFKFIVFIGNDDDAYDEGCQSVHQRVTYTLS